ncbi:SpoIIE family protein phosphatase [Paucibacter sp. TC2R-5]|uniref:ATP-binding SpoIIE family protein phosphatase n=1 Tax=Paucibacter sp. TC2R-5 TaxID=2893555 RepID=UPI0021E4D344|nr:SpoIIE family protein phosphatase [Paucibacter sp. TC2R-5]MCV2358362.1 SpoIIE family protein phosphatase [Paucibacter sp. TC2R-5]
MTATVTDLGRAQARWLRLLAPASWLSGRLSFSRKFLLVGAVMLLALALLSWPLLRKAGQDAQSAELERRGLSALAQQAVVLDTLVRQRGELKGERSGRPAAQAELQALLAWATAPQLPPNAPPNSLPALALRLQQQWQQLQELAAQDDDAQRRFAAHTGTINALLALMRESARAHRLNVDPTLDAAFEMLSHRLPLLMETLSKQQDALALSSGSMASYALAAQVVLSEATPALRAGMQQLLAPGDRAGLQAQLDELLARIERQQDAVDKVLDAPQALAELRPLASANLAQAQALLVASTAQADALLQERLTQLRRSQWQVGALLVGAMAAIAYLFAGIYVSTLRSLRRLSQGTQDFCAGRLDTRIRIDTQDELVLVAGNFNTVASEVGRLLDVIREQNESRQRELERLVQQRTLELADKNDQLHLAALRVQEELESARDMQQAILPQHFPDTADFSMQACMHPARELGGDFYDCFALSDGRWGFLVADVAGKGVGAAFFMAVSRTVLQDLAQDELSPEEVLARANDVLSGRNPMELFVTACYCIYDPRDGSLAYASAGHPAPLLRSAQGEVQALDCPRDIALGVLPGMSYSRRYAQLASGDTLLLYTDGITEAFDAAERAYGDERLIAWLQESQEPQAADKLASLVRDVADFVGGAEPSDDLTALLLCRKPRVDAPIVVTANTESPDPSASPQARGALTVSHTPLELKNKTLLLEHRLHSRVEEITPLAEAVDQALADRSDLAFAVNLCLEELITNTIQHGLHGAPDRPIHVRLSRSDEWLEIILKDDAPPFDPFVEAPEPSLDASVEERAVGGLGVHMVKTMMDEVRAFYDGSGNLIVLLKTLKR